MNDDLNDAFEMMGWNGPSMEIQPPAEQMVLSERGLVKVEKAPWIKLNVSFREVLKKLKGAKLAVFLDIALHVGKSGSSYPSIDLIAEETGYCADVVRDTIKALREMGMLNVKTRDGFTNLYTPSMYFAYGRDREPWDLEPEPLGEKPPLGESSTPPLGESSPHPSIKVLDEEEPVRKTNEEEINGGARLNAEDYKKRIEKAMLEGIRQNAGRVDVSKYPEDVQKTLQSFCTLWHMDIPKFSRKTNGEAVDWIAGAREINDACGEFGLDLLALYAEEFEKYKADHSGIAPYRVTRPGSIVKTLRGKAAEVRASGLAIQLGQEQSKNYGITFDNR